MTRACAGAAGLGCSCQAPQPVGSGHLLFATAVSHTATVLRSALAEVEASVVQRAPGLIEAWPIDPQADSSALLAAAQNRLTSVEAGEVRVLAADDRDGDALLAAALHAPTLSQSGARSEHAHLMPLFDDEVKNFYSVYQPIVSLTSAHAPTIGYEALLRAVGPDGDLIPPDKLFASAASAGWLHVLDRVGRTTALRGTSGWLGDAQLFVNFVPTTIYRPEVCLRTTEEAAEKAGLRMDQLVFEVTESEQIADVSHLTRVFDYYRAKGCRVALDDLGSGFSSLNKLVQLRPDVVKLDKQLVQGLPEPVNCAVVAAIVQMVHSYGGVVLAECIETYEQALSAQDLGVDLGQGWYYGRPEPRTTRLLEQADRTPVLPAVS